VDPGRSSGVDAAGQVAAMERWADSFMR
jgi:hypothetical protein